MTSCFEKTPVFTILVPTRERRDTLEKTLQTCFDQTYERLEVLVCDNFSQDGTDDYLRSLDDPRLRVVSTGRRLSMASNWEFALQHVTRGFVMVLGDDDGILPNSVSELVEGLVDSECEAIGWNQGIYTWPDCGRGKPENRLKLSLHRDLEICDARDALARVVGCEASYKTLPSLYWGALHTDVIDRARGEEGRFVHDVNPDVYSAVTSTMVVDRFMRSNGAYSLIGLSRHSTGASFRAGQSGEGTEVGKFFEEVDLEEHPSVPMIPSAFAYTAEAYMQARDHVPGGDRFPEPNYRTLLEAVVKQAASDNDAVYPKLVAGCERLAATHGLERELEEYRGRYPRQRYVRRESPIGLNLLRNTIKVDCAALGIWDVYEASKLAHYTLALFQQGYISPRGVLKSTVDRASARITSTMRRGKALADSLSVRKDTGSNR